MVQVKVGGSSVATLRPTDQEIAEELDWSAVNLEGDQALSLKTRAVFPHPLFSISPHLFCGICPSSLSFPPCTPPRGARTRLIRTCTHVRTYTTTHQSIS